MRLTWLSIIVLTSFSVPLKASADTFDVSPTTTTQNDLFYDLTDTFTHKVYPNIDTLRFSRSSDFYFVLNRAETPGSAAPGFLTSFDENRAYQNLIFENSSPTNTWTLSAHEISGGNPSLIADLRTKSLTLTNTALAFQTRPRVGTQFTDVVGTIGLNAGAPGATALLALNNAHIATAGSPETKFRFSSDTLISVSGTDNRISAPGGALIPSVFSLELRLSPSSVLDLVGGTEIRAESNGYLTLEQGSTLNIQDSQVFLTRFKDETNLSTESSATIDAATVQISGLFGNPPASLFLSNPQISNSTIVLGNNNRILSLLKSVKADFENGDFFFTGDNSIKLGSGALLSGWANGSDSISAFKFSNGKNSIEGTGSFNAVVRALDISLDSASLEYKNVDFGLSNTDGDLNFLTLRNQSTFKTVTDISQFKNLSYLIVADSTLSGANFYSEDALLKASLTNATLRIEQPSRTSATSFYLKGVDGFGPDGKATVNFSGSNTVVSRIDPAGKDVGIDRSVVTGVNSYSDVVYFTRISSFTDETASVTGLATLTAQLKPFAPDLKADDYASGGKNGDGVYDVLMFTGDGVPPATADSDTVAVSLSSTMPALLTATQVAAPSTDNKVSYKLSVDAGQLQKQSVTSNQSSLAQILALTGAGSTGSGGITPLGSAHHGTQLVSGLSLAQALLGLSQAQWSQLSEQHGEPYASFMTVGLEQNLMVASMVMDHASGSGEFIDKGIAGLPSGRLGATALNKPNQPKRRVWGDIRFSEGSVSAQNDLAGYDYQLGSLIFGTDFYESELSSAGVFTGLGFSQMTSHDTANANFQSLGVNLGLYGRHRLPYEVNVTAMAGLNYNFIDSRRSVRSVGSFQGGNATADYNSWGTFAGLRLDRSFELASDRSYITPVLEMTYAGQSFGAATEGNGGDLGFNIGSGYADALIGGVGFDLSHSWESQGTGFVIDALFRYEYDFFANANSHHSLDMQSQLTGYNATVYGIDRGAQGLSAGLGLTALISDSTSLTVGYKYTDWSHGTQQQFGANLTVRW